MSTSLQKRLALALLRDAVRQVRRAEKELGMDVGALPQLTAAVKDLENTLAGETPSRHHPGVTVTTS